jgi:hypothetical protein
MIIISILVLPYAIVSNKNIIESSYHMILPLISRPLISRTYDIIYDIIQRNLPGVTVHHTTVLLAQELRTGPGGWLCACCQCICTRCSCFFKLTDPGPEVWAANWARLIEQAGKPGIFQVGTLGPGKTLKVFWTPARGLEFELERKLKKVEKRSRLVT